MEKNIFLCDGQERINSTNSIHPETTDSQEEYQDKITRDNNNLANSVSEIYQAAYEYAVIGDSGPARKMLPQLRESKSYLLGTIYEGPIIKLIEHLESGSEVPYSLSK